MQDTNLVVIFLTGLFTGGLTCLAVQGGLLASTIAQREQDRYTEDVKKGNARPILFFLLAKLVAYTLLGFLLGWFGSLFEISLTAKVVMQFVVAIFMIGTALNLLNVHPFFRYFAIQPPKFLTRMVRNQSKSKDIFAPALLGAFTVFIPCGTTQAMMALAIGAGSPLYGAAILFAFVLGTAPLFFILGYFTTKMEDRFQKNFLKFAAFAIIALSFYNLYGAWNLTGATFGLKTSQDGAQAGMSAIPTVDVATISIEENEYSPSSIYVKAGEPFTLNLKNVSGRGCIQAFTIPKLGVQKVVAVGSSETFQLIAPKEKGPLAFMCSMGMYRGVINVM